MGSRNPPIKHHAVGSVSRWASGFDANTALCLGCTSLGLAAHYLHAIWNKANAPANRLKVLAGFKHESLVPILYLDRKNVLIADEEQAKGTVDHVPVYPREVVKRALELNASSLILVHNHPSGDPTPSKADIEVTERVQDACETLGILIHDHVITMLLSGKRRNTLSRATGFCRDFLK